jgi:hypothetical protein
MRARLALLVLCLGAAAACRANPANADLAGNQVGDLAGVDLLARDLANSDAMFPYSCDPPPIDAAECTTDEGCALVSDGCYCGDQPVYGVAFRYRDGAGACEGLAASTCALGCPVTIGFVAQDGKSTMDRSLIKVRCADKQPSGVGACKSYLP